MKNVSVDVEYIPVNAFPFVGDLVRALSKSPIGDSGTLYHSSWVDQELVVEKIDENTYHAYMDGVDACKEQN